MTFAFEEINSTPSRAQIEYNSVSSGDMLQSAAALRTPQRPVRYGGASAAGAQLIRVAARPLMSRMSLVSPAQPDTPQPSAHGPGQPNSYAFHPRSVRRRLFPPAE